MISNYSYYSCCKWWCIITAFFHLQLVQDFSHVVFPRRQRHATGALWPPSHWEGHVGPEADWTHPGGARQGMTKIYRTCFFGIRMKPTVYLVGGFPYIGNVMLPTDELIFFRGVGIPPTSWYRWQYFCHSFVIFTRFPAFLSFRGCFNENITR